MLSRIHKILIHGSEIIKLVILPIGQLSEDAQKCKIRIAEDKERGICINFEEKCH
jgi:hypothetical protein